MSTSLRIAFAGCSVQVDAVRKVAPRFAAVADVQAYPLPFGAFEAAVPALAAAEPHVVVAPKLAVEVLARRLGALIVPFELTADDVASRLAEALEGADRIGLFTKAGEASPSLVRLVQEAAGRVELLVWESRRHLRELIARCRRRGIRAVVGGGDTVSLAAREGLLGLSIYERPGEPAGVITRMIAEAATRGGPRLFSRPEELEVFGFVVRKICEGIIGPLDTVLSLDEGGHVLGVFSGAARRPPTDPAERSAARMGDAFMESLVALMRRGGARRGGNRPVRVDLYTLVDAGSGGHIGVVRGGLRHSPAGTDRDARRPTERLDTLLARADSALAHLEAVAEGRQPALPRRLVGSIRGRSFLLDWRRVRYFELRSGLVHAATDDGETYVTRYTLSEILARTDPRDFLRIHSHVIVNLNYVTEIERFHPGRVRLVLDGPGTTAFVASRPASAALRKLLGA